MADTNITIPELGSLTAGQLSDLLLVTRGTTGYKMLVSDIAKTIIETYAGSSLAGSAQSVKAALDSLNSSYWALVGGIEIPVNSNIDTYTTPGSYGTSSSANARTMSGLPFPTGDSKIYAFNLKVENSALNDPNARRQVLQFYNDRHKWIRFGSISSGWEAAWERI